MGPVRQNPIQRTVRSVDMCALHCAQSLHTILYRTDLIISPLPPYNHHCSDDVYLMEGGRAESIRCYMGGPDLPWEGAILVDREPIVKYRDYLP